MKVFQIEYQNIQKEKKVHHLLNQVGGIKVKVKVRKGLFQLKKKYLIV